LNEDLDSFDELKKKILQTLKQIDPLFSSPFLFSKLLYSFLMERHAIKISVYFDFFTGGEKWVAHLQKDPLKINLSIMVSFLFSSDQITI